MRRALMFVVSMLAAILPGSAAAGAQNAQDLGERLQDARSVFRELLDTPDRGVPQALLERCTCIAVIPHVLKGAIGYGARFGQGVVSCRDTSGWSPPAFLRLTGGSIGFQIGAESSDVVLFFMTERGARSLLDSKFTLGAKAGVAAGPVGRTGEASTDLNLNAEIYSYAKSKGLFAGISLEGARLSPDEKAITAYYGAKVPVKDVLFAHRVPKVPPEAEAFRSVLP